MKRKAAFFITLLVIFAGMLSGALAELDLTDSEGYGVGIIYIPGTQNDTRITTARYIKEALLARWSGSESFAKNITQNNVKPEADDAVFKKGSQPGEGTLKDNVVTELRQNDYHLWFLVPQEAANGFCGNTELFDQLEKLTKDRITRVHIVFIGDSAAEVGAGSALAAFAEKTGKADWTWVASDFLSNTRRTEGNRKVQTGFYFVASLFGTPVDLKINAGENALISLPEGVQSNVLILAETDTFDEDDAITSDANGKELAISLNKRAKAYHGLLIENAFGSHSITAPTGATSLQAYYYPDLKSIQPELKVGTDEGNLKRGETVLTLKAANDLDRPETFQISFECKIENSDIATRDISLPGKYDAEEKAWTATLSIQAGDIQLTVLPRARLDTEDGNAVWDWKGEAKSAVIETTAVEKVVNAPADVLIYYNGSRSGKFTYTWNQFFTYNSADAIKPGLTEESLKQAKETGFQIQENTNGFTVRFGTGSQNNKEKEADALQQSVKKTVLVLDCGGVKHELELTAENLAALNQTVVLSIADSSSQGTGGLPGIPAGGSFTVTATIPGETAAKYEEAKAQDMLFPRPENMDLRITDAGGLTVSETKQRFTRQNGQDGSWSASVTVHVPEESKASDGSALSAEVKDTNSTEVIQSTDALKIRIINEKPHLKNDTHSLTQAVGLSGLPVEWSGIPVLKNIIPAGVEISLAEKLFGTEDLFSLFTDDETGITSVTITVEPTGDGLILPEETADTSWTQTIQRGETIPPIKARPMVENATYIVKLVASDGVNDSEAATGTLSIRSDFVRIVTLAALALLVLILLLIVFLIIRQVRKPSFDSIHVRCLVSSDGDEARCKELMEKCDSVPLLSFGKKAAPLSVVLTMAHQPPLCAENAVLAEDISLKPSKHDDIIVCYGKKALKAASSHRKKESVPLGGEQPYNLRLGNTYILIENVR